MLMGKAVLVEGAPLEAVLLSLQMASTMRERRLPSRAVHAILSSLGGEGALRLGSVVLCVL